MAIITIVGSILMAVITASLKQRFTGIQMDRAKQIAEIAVTFAEQIQITLGAKGPVKYASALTKAKEIAAKAGITMTDAQWQGLIEASLKELSSVWNSTNSTVTTSISNGEGSTINTILSTGNVDNILKQNDKQGE